ncbi:MAG TPA: S8 family serine peptidase, partial [Patescibacteria group bacterium]|nr:S8 family serine peptidase [Patescibacteria group bacterium]
SHGTIVSGVAAAAGDNDMGITGVTWQTSIMPLRVLNDTGEGGANGVIRAIDYAIANGADIINLSFVGPGRSDSMHEAILRAHKAGVIVVAAAGNEKSAGHGYDLDRNPMYPVCYDSEYGEDVIIGVGATDPLDQKADFSSYGKCVDIMAPGSSVFSTVTYNPNKQMEDGGYLDKKYDGFWSGTSMAAPMVSGTLALIKAANPQLNYKQVKQVLLSSTDNIDKLNPRFFGEIGAGRLNVSKSVERALELLNSRKIKLLLSPQSHRSSQVQISDYNSEVVRDLEAFPFSFAGGINNIGADVDGDGTQEIIVGAGSGGGPQLRIFSFQGELRNQFFAYNPYFRGGVNVASGDINGDGRDEIITGAGPGGGPHIRVFNGSGHVKGQFFAYAPSFRGGVRVALGNVDQGGETNQEEIITAPQSRGGPHIRVFNNKMRVINQFFAYNPSFRGGVNITSGDMNQDGVAEVITGAGPGGGPHVRYFNLNGEIINSFYAYDKDFDGGVNVGIINIK